LGASAKVDTHARLEGRNMTMVLSPEKKAPKKQEPKPAPKAQVAPAAEATSEPAVAEQAPTDI
jgi:translation initiation factor IF-3